jgi:Bacterial regulatory proteins, gntR family
MIGTKMAEPIHGIPTQKIGAAALADLLGRWPAAEGPLYRLLAARISRLTDAGELPAGLRLPAERDLAAALSVSRNRSPAPTSCCATREWQRAATARRPA